MKIACFYIFLINLTLSSIGYSQNMSYLSDKFAKYQANQNYDSALIIVKKIVKLADKQKYPRDITYIGYKYLLANLYQKTDSLDQSLLISNEIEQEFFDTLELYSNLKINISTLKLNGYYLKKDIENFNICAISLIKEYKKNYNYEAKENIDFILRILPALINYGRIDYAEKIFSFITEYYLNDYKSNKDQYLRGQSFLVNIYIKKGEYELGLNICDEIIQSKNFSASQKRVFKISKVTFLVDLDDYFKASALNLEIINEMKSSCTSKTEDSLGFQYIQQAVILTKMSNIKDAPSYFEKGIDIFRKQLLNEENRNLGWALAHYAGFFQENNLISQSIELNKESLNLRMLNETQNSYQISHLYNALAENYFSLGDLPKALDYSSLAMDICLKYYDSTYPIYYTTLSNLAVYENSAGNIQKSIELNLKVLELKSKALGVDNLDYAISLNNIACAYGSLGDNNKAIEFAEKSKLIREKIVGNKHPQYGLSLANLAVNYSLSGKNKKALEYNLEALNIYKDFGFEITNNFSLCLDNISLCYVKEYDYSNAYKYSIYSAKNNFKVFQKNRFGLDEKLIQKSKNRLNVSMCLVMNHANKLIYELNEIYKIWINSNGTINNEAKIIRDRIQKTGDSLVVSILEEIKQWKLQLMQYQQAKSSAEDRQKNEEIILVNKIENLEMELSRFSKDFAELNRAIVIQDVEKNLKINEVLIDFVTYPKYNFRSNLWTDSTQYLVFITDSKDTIVDYVFIEDGNKIDQGLFDQYKQEATNFDNKTELKDTSFYNSFWKPIADKIVDAKTIYVSLGGVYNNINLNTLYNPETGKYLLEEKDIRIVNSARDFVLSKEQEKKIYTTNTAALFGFPDFNGNTTVAVDSTDFLASTRDLNSFWLDSLTRGGLKANPLPATKIEVENISLTLKSKGWQVNSYLAENASESNIKKQESPRILHIATHGYFFPDIPIDKDNTRFLGMDRQQVVQDPMLRSGLLFTGANRTLKGEETKGENGLLSAAEASLLDLRETELVVLSACETGKGEVKNSEGVYGLRKAFSDAGAKNIIMSLWKVDDKVTQEFMSRFYEIWLNEKTTIREAFNKTQLEIKAKYPQPYYWGAFILVGE